METSYCNSKSAVPESLALRVLKAALGGGVYKWLERKGRKWFSPRPWVVRVLFCLFCFFGHTMWYVGDLSSLTKD